MKGYVLKKNNKLNYILISVIGFLLTIGLISGLVHLVNNFTDEKGLISVSPKFEIGELTETGKYHQSDYSIYTKDAFKCKDLEVILDFDNNIKYKVYFYDKNQNYLSCSNMLIENCDFDVPENAIYARLVIYQLEQTDEPLKNIFDVRKLSKQLEIKVAKNQNPDYVLYEFELINGRYDPIVQMPIEEPNLEEGFYNIGYLSKKELPVGSYIVFDFVNDAELCKWEKLNETSQTPQILTGEGKIEITEQFWNSCEYFSININVNDIEDFNINSFDDIITIYVPNK